MTNCDSNDLQLEKIKAMIEVFPDFPKPGIQFRDIFPIFRDPNAVDSLVNILVENVRRKVDKVDVIVGLESRGFLLGPLMAIKLGAAFAPIRKKGKLPGKCFDVSYSLEYGKDSFEAQCSAVKEGQHIVIVDDLLATGGTMLAASQLISDMGGDIKLCLVVIELTNLNGESVEKKTNELLVRRKKPRKMYLPGIEPDQAASKSDTLRDTQHFTIDGALHTLY